MIWNLISQVDGSNHIRYSETCRADFSKISTCLVANIVDNKEVPDRIERRWKGGTKEGAIHDDLDYKDEKKDDAGCWKHSFEYLFDHSYASHDPESDFLLNTSPIVIDEEHKELQIRDESNHNKHYHVNVPVEAKV